MNKSRYLALLSLGLFLIAPGAIEVDAQLPVKTAEAPAPAPTVVKVWVTAYASVPELTDDTPFITASGRRVRDGIVAANFLPFGTEIMIPEVFGEKIFVVQDRMSRRKTDFIDVWMPTKAEAVTFGITKANVVILNPTNQKSNPEKET